MPFPSYVLVYIIFIIYPNTQHIFINGWHLKYFELKIQWLTDRGRSVDPPQIRQMLYHWATEVHQFDFIVIWITFDVYVALFY